MGRSVPQLSLPALAPSFGMKVPSKLPVQSPAKSVGLRPAEVASDGFRMSALGLVYSPHTARERETRVSEPREAKVQSARRPSHRAPPKSSRAPNSARAVRHHVPGGDYRLDARGRRFDRAAIHPMQLDTLNKKQHVYGGDFRLPARGAPMKQRLDAAKCVRWKMGEDGMWHGDRGSTPFSQALPTHTLTTDLARRHVMEGDYRQHIEPQRRMNAQDKETLDAQQKHVLRGDFRVNASFLHPEFDSAPPPPVEQDHHVLQGDFRKLPQHPERAAISSPDEFS